MSTSVYDKPVVVVGAGVAGLVCAHLLAESGAKVVVIEKLDQLGGLARTYEYEGFTFDVGPHRFHTENPNIDAYIKRVLEGNSTFFPRVSEVHFRDKYYSWPLKPQHLHQLPPEIAAKAFVDLAVNNFQEYDSDNFEGYILQQYGPTLYEHFFKHYSIKFLGIHPRDTHPDWAKTGLNRAVIDNNVQMNNTFQLLKSTLKQFNAEAPRYVYPKGGLHQTWFIIRDAIEKLGGKVILGQGARLEGGNGRVERVYAGDECFEPSQVIWTAPITLALKQLTGEHVDLDYLGLLLYNVLVDAEPERDFQWCYFGAKNLVFNRVSTPKCFSPDTCPPGTHGLNVEVTCMKGDQRWRNPGALTDWVVDDLIQTGLVKRRKDVINVYTENIENSYPIYKCNYPGELEKARKSLAQYDNLVLAGRTGLFWYNNMDHSIENAMQTVKRLLRASGRNEASEQLLATGTLGV